MDTAHGGSQSRTRRASLTRHYSLIFKAGGGRWGGVGWEAGARVVEGEGNGGGST